MKIGYKYYKITGKDLLEISLKTFKDYGKAQKAWLNFAKKCGASPTVLRVGSSTYSRLLGITFKKTPDTKAWLHVGQNYWRPRGNGTKKDLYKEYKSLPKWDSKELEKAVGFNIIFDGGFAYFFSAAIDKNGAVFRVPIFSKKTKDNTYIPVKGVKEISMKSYTNFIEKLSKENNDNL